VALFLGQHGYQASALTGGLDAWKQAGLPLEPMQAPKGS
jgi:rhodanese-related sulfurtransferase